MRTPASFAVALSTCSHRIDLSQLYLIFRRQANASLAALPFYGFSFAIASARKLLVVIWRVWTAHAADRQANLDLVAFKLMTWSWKLTNEQRGGLTTRQFVRYQLMHLGLGHDLAHVVRGGAPRPTVPLEIWMLSIERRGL